MNLRYIYLYLHCFQTRKRVYSVDCLYYIEYIKELLKKDNVEVLDFTQSINIKGKDILETLEFTKKIDVSNVKKINKRG